jgi:hypothetical protein
MNLILKIYDDNGKNIVKTYESTTYDLMFGTVKRLMELLKIEDIDNQVEMLKTIYDAWEEIKTVLAGVFPDVQPDEWEHVKVKELLPLIVDIAKFSVQEIFIIPKEKN